MSDTDQPDRDTLTRFLLERSGVRGTVVHLDKTWQTIRTRATYPEPVAERLGETCAAAALFTGQIKVDGRLSVQLRGTGALRTLFAECTAAGTLRGIAHYTDPLPEPLTPRAFGDGSVLAITIETLPPGAQEIMRYQGMVSLDAEHLAEAFEGYFIQSEQLPTRVLLAANGNCAAAVMLQQLPEGHGDPDGWTRNCAIFDTLSGHELLNISAETLLWRLFHDQDVRLLGQQPLRFACSCSRARVEDMLHSLGQHEAEAALKSRLVKDDVEGGSGLIAEIYCDFCGQRYQFNANEISSLFAVPEANGPSSERLQ